MKVIAILISKIIIFVGTILKRGTSLPGKVALKIDKNLLKKLKYPKKRIVVTGSSGKGSSSKLITEVLRQAGFTVCHNGAGSNLSYGVTTALIKNSTLFGKIKTDYLVLEIDERYTKNVLKYIKPNYLVVTNLTKDQPPRQHAVDDVYQIISSAIPKNTHVITLMDEPLMRYLKKDLPNEISYFGLDKNKYSYKNQIFENLNTTYCPKCESSLVYDYYNFETLGKYHCSKCDFSYELPKTIGKNLDLATQTINIDKEIVLIGGDCLYDAYNTTAAFAALKKVGLNSKEIATYINEIRKEPITPYFINHDKQFRYFGCKSENASTFNHALFKIKTDNELKDVIIGWSIISKRYSHTDVSWLYDIEFEFLNNPNTHKVYVCGLNKYDLEKRLILSGISPEKIEVAEDLPSLKDKIMESEANHIYCLSHYDYGNIFNKTFKEDQNGN